jgi:hypothetical protein
MDQDQDRDQDLFLLLGSEADPKPPEPASREIAISVATGKPVLALVPDPLPFTVAAGPRHARGELAGRFSARIDDPPGRRPPERRRAPAGRSRRLTGGPRAPGVVDRPRAPARDSGPARPATPSGPAARTRSCKRRDRAARGGIGVGAVRARPGRAHAPGVLVVLHPMIAQAGARLAATPSTPTSPADDELSASEPRLRQSRRQGSSAPTMEKRVWTPDELAEATDRVLEVIRGDVRWRDATPGDRAVWKGRMRNVEMFGRGWRRELRAGSPAVEERARRARGESVGRRTRTRSRAGAARSPPVRLSRADVVELLRHGGNRSRRARSGSGSSATRTSATSSVSNMQLGGQLLPGDMTFRDDRVVRVSLPIASTALDVGGENRVHVRGPGRADSRCRPTDVRARSVHDRRDPGAPRGRAGAPELQRRDATSGSPRRGPTISIRSM